MVGSEKQFIRSIAQYYKIKRKGTKMVQEAKGLLDFILAFCRKVVQQNNPNLNYHRAY